MAERPTDGNEKNGNEYIEMKKTGTEETDTGGGRRRGDLLMSDRNTATPQRLVMDSRTVSETPIDYTRIDPRRDGGAVRNIITDEKKEFLKEELGIKVREVDGPNSDKLVDKFKIIIENGRKTGAQYNGKKIIVFKPDRKGFKISDAEGLKNEVKNFKEIFKKAEQEYAKTSDAQVRKKLVSAIAPQGERGLPGPQGERGAQGERGQVGERGLPGPQGESGAQGERGQVGDRGLPGQAGAQGEREKDGKQGERGKDGKTGKTGAQGEQGERGKDGKQGERGKDGKTGKTGERGQDGKQDERGEQGERGAQGERGERGPAGAGGVSEAHFNAVFANYTMQSPTK